MGLRRSAAVALVLASLVALPAHDATAADGQPHVIDIAPAPGQVVAVGGVTITAVLATDASVSDTTLVVDGVERDHRLEAAGSNQRLVARVDLVEGHHIAMVAFTDSAGRSTSRAWRFANAALPVRRLAGTDRIGTAIALSRDSFPAMGSATGAVIATASDFPDGLAAAPLATQLGGPLLLSAADALSSATAEELVRAVEPGARVALLGGEGALSDTVATEVADLGFEVVRVAGSGRAETAVAIARRLKDTTTVIVASGRGFADGLAAAAPAARDGIPILLTEPDELSTATRDFLVARRPERAVIVGGAAAVDAAVEAAIAEIVPQVDRIAGADRYRTAAAIVEEFFDGEDEAGIAIASGADFPDALAGGPHAGARGIPLLLTPPTSLAPSVTDRVEDQPPGDVMLYGGASALDPVIDEQLRIAAADGTGGPVVTLRTPPATVVVNTLDTVEFGLDRGVDLNHSTLYLSVDGREIPGITTQGDFTDRLVFQVAELPFDPLPDTDYAIVVHAQAYDGERWRHDRWEFTYRRIALARGDSGPAVQAIQERLTDLGYWLGEPDGNFGTLTSQALMAFQKYEELERSGIADAVTRERLEVAIRPRPTANRSGRWVEIDKGRQVMLFVLNGNVEWAMNTSTGTEGPFTRPDGSKGVAHTPEGWFTFFREIDGMREADLGQMWRPKYFTSAGHAIHGSTSIPAYPASHGCARLSYPAIDFVWAAGLAPVGTPLLVHT